MAPLRSIAGRSLGKLLEGFKTSTLGQGFGSGGSTGTSISASGGIVDGLFDNVSNYAYHTFIEPGTFTVTGQATGAEILVIAPGGGGAGGNGASGGGGAGGIVYLTGHTLQSGEYTITIPAGGAGGPAANNSGDTGGDATVVHPFGLTLTAKGGGGGAGWTQGNGRSGGSGGGGSGPGSSSGGSSTQAATVQNAGIGGGTIIKYGYAGGDSPGSQPFMGGGGGGTGQVGSGGGPGPGAGGNGEQFSSFTGNLIGLPFINPLAGQYGGGGGGMSEVPQSRDGGSGGSGGGGRGAISRPQWAGSPGLVFTGSGGGGGQWWPGGSTAGGDGAQGMVVIRYPQPVSALATGTAHTYGYRYWRLYKLDGAQGGSWTNEVQFFEVGSNTYYSGTNYQNYTGSNLVSFDATKVTNGNTATNDNCFHTDTSGVGSWLKLDLGANNLKYFNRVKIWTGGSATAYWRLEASNNDSNWTVMHKGAQVNGLTSLTIEIGS